MSIFNNFSYKLFGVITALFYVGLNCALADPAVDVAPSGIENPSGNSVRTIDLDAIFNTPLKLCASGYYLSGCNQIQIGTNWLKGIKGTDGTPDYYSYGSSSSDTIHITNLRKFFAGIEPISYKPENNSQTATVNPSVYSQYRNQILTAFCTDGDGKVKNIECKKCPNGSNILESTVAIGNSSGKIVQSSWNVHTIADCYMDEFSDHTGTYVYAKNNDQNGTQQKCYYSNNIEGEELVSE